MKHFVGDKVLEVIYVPFHKVETVLSHLGMHALVTINLEGDGTEKAIAITFHFDHF
jgi:nitrogen regulatory protein PII